MDTNPTPTLCRICLRSCGILVSQRKDGIRITGNPQHPVSKGFICFRGAHYHKIWGSSLRIKEPLLRKGNNWVPVTYDDALDILAQKIEHSKNKYGAESVALLKGESLKHQEISRYMKHLTHALGSPNYLSIGSMCQRALVMGHELTYGGVPRFDMKRIKTAILWGRNIAESSPQMFDTITRAHKNGMKFLVIDPSATKTAREADIHLRITPGSDGYLALAFIKAAIEEYQLHPDPRQERGWTMFKNYVQSLTTTYLLEKSGIEESDFRAASAMIFTNLPCWNQAGLGLELQPNGVQTIRAVACLQSLVDPGRFYSSMEFPFNPLPNQKSYPPMPHPIGHRQAPLFVNQRGEGQAMFLPKAIIENDPYPVRTLFIAGANPLLTFPATSRQRDALRKLDFLVVADLFMTETAKAADLVLPSADFLNNLEIHDYGRVGKPYLGLIRPIQNEGPGWPMWKWIFEIAQKLKLKSFFPWSDNEEALEYRLANSGIHLKDLQENQASVVPYPSEISFKSSSNSSGKIHFFSEAAAETADAGMLMAHSFELPFHTNPEYPLWLSTGDRVAAYQHSQFRISAEYLQKMPEPQVELHPEVAQALGMQSGEMVFVATRYGKVKVQARVTDEVRKDCLRMTHGWEQANVNELTGLEYFDSLSGFPWCRAMPAQIFK